MFQTRQADGSIPLAAQPAATLLYLEPPDGAQGHGDALTTPGGQRQLTLGDWLSAGGEARVRCSGSDTALELTLDGLVPGGLYTVWILATTVALDYGVDRLPTFFARQDFIDERFLGFLGPAGPADGSGSTFTASADGAARFSATVSAIVDGTDACLLDAADHWFILPDYHPDGRSYGPLARPASGPSAQAAHLGFAFSYRAPVLSAPP